jgi:outer membrane protein OmpA-like peptidoglycan-associated protein
MPVEDTSIRHIRLGAAPGVGWNFYKASFPSVCAEFQDATARGAGFTLFFEVPPFGSLPSLLFSSHLRALNLSADFASGLTAYQGSKVDQNGQRVFYTINKQQHFKSGITGVGLSVGPLWKLDFLPLPGLRLGPEITAIALQQGRLEQTEEIVGSANDVFAGGEGQSRPVDGARLTLNPFALDAGLSLGMMIQLDRRWSIYPEVRGNLLLTSLAKDFDWKGGSILMSLGAAYDFAPEPDSTPQPPPVEQPPPPHSPYLAATITARGIDKEGKEYADPVIEIEEAPWVDIVPIIPYVFFDRGSSTIPARYVQLAGREEADRFSVDSLERISPLDIHWQGLNVLGSRLRQHPEADVTVSGGISSDEDEGESLALERAGAIRRYLTEIWGIDPTRIRVASDSVGLSSEATEDGRQENRRAELNFTNNGITGPVVIRRTARVASPPAILFYPDIVADTTVAAWNITIFQGDKDLLRFEGTGQRQSLRQNRSWSLSDLRVNRDLSDVGYRLDVVDVVGTRAFAEGSFRVAERVTERNDSLAHRQLIEFGLVGFNYNSADLLPVHRNRLLEVADSITDGVQIRIAGYTDRMGDPGHNRELALARAQTVSDALQSTLQNLHRPLPVILSVEGLGGDNPPFNNDLPEGRILSRMVQITISRPAGK